MILVYFHHSTIILSIPNLSWLLPNSRTYQINLNIAKYPHMPFSVFLPSHVRQSNVPLLLKNLFRLNSLPSKFYFISFIYFRLNFLSSQFRFVSIPFHLNFLPPKFQFISFRLNFISFHLNFNFINFLSSKFLSDAPARNTQTLN